jgi:HSP20 family molecular chaperone IbpA
MLANYLFEMPNLNKFFYNSADELYSSEKNYRISSTSEKTMISIDMPGAKISDVNLFANGEILEIDYSIRGEKYNQKFKINTKFDISTTKAKLEDGVMDIEILRSSDQLRKKIEISS